MTLRWDEFRRSMLPADPYWSSQPEAAMRAVYEAKYEVARRLQPRRIAEIGVRAGYSALAFLQAAPEAEYVGFDNDSANDGGAAGALAWASHVLGPYRARIELADSQALTRLPHGPYDLVHVDAAHDFVGAYHDIALAAAAGRYVLVDDYDFILEVRLAVHEVLKEHPELGSEHISDGGVRGNMLIHVPTQEYRRTERPSAHVEAPQGASQ